MREPGHFPYDRLFEAGNSCTLKTVLNGDRHSVIVRPRGETGLAKRIARASFSLASLKSEHSRRPPFRERNRKTSSTCHSVVATRNVHPRLTMYVAPDVSCEPSVSAPAWDGRRESPAPFRRTSGGTYLHSGGPPEHRSASR